MTITGAPRSVAHPRVNYWPGTRLMHRAAWNAKPDGEVRGLLEQEMYRYEH
jgi:hypothetical protein